MKIAFLSGKNRCNKYMGKKCPPRGKLLTISGSGGSLTASLARRVSQQETTISDNNSYNYSNNCRSSGSMSDLFANCTFLGEIWNNKCCSLQTLMFPFPLSPLFKKPGTASSPSSSWSSLGRSAVSRGSCFQSPGFALPSRPCPSMVARDRPSALEKKRAFQL